MALPSVPDPAAQPDPRVHETSPWPALGDAWNAYGEALKSAGAAFAALAKAWRDNPATSSSRRTGRS